MAVRSLAALYCLAVDPNLADHNTGVVVAEDSFVAVVQMTADRTVLVEIDILAVAVLVGIADGIDSVAVAVEAALVDTFLPVVAAVVFEPERCLLSQDN